jgi:hypothetical protein
VVDACKEIDASTFARSCLASITYLFIPFVHVFDTLSAYLLDMLGRQCRLCLSYQIRSASNVSSATRTCSISTSRHAVFSSSLFTRTPSSRTVCSEINVEESSKDDAAIGNNPYTATTHHPASAPPSDLPLSLAPSMLKSLIGALDIDGTTRGGEDDIWWGSTRNDTSSRRSRDKYRIEALRHTEYE